MPEVGGVERVTYDLGKWFVSRGHNVYCLVLLGNIADHSMFPFLCLKLPEKGSWGTEVNVQSFREIQRIYRIDIVIVQSERAQALELCSRGLKKGVKVISVLHSSPVTQRGYFWDDCLLPHLIQYGFWKTLLQFPLMCASYCINRSREVQWERQRLLVMYSIVDKYVTLSENFHKELIRLGKLTDNGHKLIAIPNPLSMPTMQFDASKKEKILLWVGRLVFLQKRPDRIIGIWKKIARNSLEWKLCIVGDGEVRHVLENYCQKKDIPNVVFVGRQPSEAWYRKAQIICMTSSWEGFPCVLGEAMNFGCIPVVYNSFSSLSNIIKDNENGFVIKAFDENQYISRLKWLMTNEKRRNVMAQNAMTYVRRYSVDIVGPQWESLFLQL